MALPKNILYPIDFSDRCRAVWPAVSNMARQLEVPVTMFHALDFHRWDEAIGAAGLETIRGQAKENLERFLAAEPHVPNLRRELAEGPAAECIIQRAAKIEAPLIMMPTRGHTRFRQLLLGSVTAAVLHDALCPVWTEAHVANQLANSTSYRSVVCAIDMSLATPEVLQAACGFSAKLGAALHIVHSVPGIDPRFPSGPAERAHRFLVDKALEDFPVHCSKAGIRAFLEIVEDPGIVDGIIASTTKHSGDLLIIGRGVIRGHLGRLRTNAHELIRRSPCPVLSV